MPQCVTLRSQVLGCGLTSSAVWGGRQAGRMGGATWVLGDSPVSPAVGTALCSSGEPQKAPHRGQAAHLPSVWGREVGEKGGTDAERGSISEDLPQGGERIRGKGGFPKSPLRKHRALHRPEASRDPAVDTTGVNARGRNACPWPVITGHWGLLTQGIWLSSRCATPKGRWTPQGLFHTGDPLESYPAGGARREPVEQKTELRCP